MAAGVFVSYARADQTLSNWLERLNLYLAQARRAGDVDVWHDGRIEAGADWRAEIRQALAEARVAILLVGPGFLASRFVQEEELPLLLAGARTRDVRVFPLVTGWCGYGSSVLQSFQAFNDPGQPLESLPLPDQNRILNDLAVAVSRAVDRPAVERRAVEHGEPAARGTAARHALERLADEMQLSDLAFRSQNGRCRALVERVSNRLGVTEKLEFEMFLYRYHGQMTPDERFEFQQIRAVTDSPLAEVNRKMLDILLDNPSLTELIPSLTKLRQHLVFWLNKYERVFRSEPRMAVCYVGVEDGVPWPREVDRDVAEWLKAH
jgi:hypothetical protein